MPIAQGIFTIACMVEHSCIPTGHRCFNSDMSITVTKMKK